MPKSFLNNLLNFDLARSYAPTFLDGVFSMVNNTIIRVRGCASDFNADLELRSDFQVAGKNKKAKNNLSYTNYTGYNKKFIDDNGEYDPFLATTEFAKLATDKRLFKDDTHAIIRSQAQADSHESFIYNMLISWGKALLYRMNKGQDDTFRVATYPYSDSHVDIALDASFTKHEYEITLGLPVNEALIDNHVWEYRRPTEYFKRPYVLYYNKQGLGQESFYLAHTLGRTNTSALNFDVDIVGIQTQSLTLEPIGGSEFLEIAIDDIPWDNPEMLWMYITEYVTMNRVQHAFAAAFETFSAMFCHPVWSSAEATVYQAAQLNIVLPQFSPTRARLRVNLEGESYAPDPMAIEFTVNNLREPEAFIQNAAISNYYMWYGMYSMIHNEGISRNDWRMAFTSAAGDLQHLYTPIARAVAISAITGHDYPTSMHEGCFMSIDFELVGKITHITDHKDKDGALGPVIPVDHIFAPVSGSLILGAVAGPYDTLQHLKGVQRFGVNGDLTTTVIPQFDAVQIANVYRLFGHNVTFMDQVTRTEIHPWATAHECIIEPASVMPIIDKPYALVAVDSENRTGRNYTLPHLMTMLQYGYADVLIQKPTLRAVNWRSRKTTLKPYYSKRRIPVKGEFRVLSAYVASPATVKSYSKRPDYKQQGFQDDGLKATPTAPEGTTVVALPPAESSVHIEPGLVDV